jgi:TRAP-type C4-dicarboxylate transport system permease small subunit
VNNPRRTWIGLGVIAVVALLIVVLPNGGSFVELVSNTINAVFLAAIGIAMVSLYRSQGEWLSALTDRNRGIVYGAISISLLAIVAVDRFRELWNGGIVLVIVIVGACGAAIYWVWRDSKRWVI